MSKETMEEELNHTYTSEIICPYCGYDFTDSWEFALHDNTEGSTDCGCCGREFDYTVNTEITYNTYRKPEAKK